MLSDCESVGGAAVAATRLSASLIASGAAVTRIVARPQGDHDAAGAKTIVIRAPFRIPTRLTFARVAWLARRTWSKRSERALSRALDEIAPDVISIHNLHNATTAGWSPRFVEICAARAPTVWTLHDMWSFTGRCAHSGACMRFVDGCDASCPTPNEYPAFPRAHIREEWIARRRIIDDHPNLIAVAPSKWLAARATSGLWPTQRVRVIPNGVDTSVFAPENREAARRRLDIDVPADRRVALMVTQDFRDPQKGASLLASALRGIGHEKLLCLTLGKRPEAVHWGRANVQHLGWIDGDARKALVYSAADFIIHPSLAENLPNVVIEALACGTPAVAFDAGGVSEAVRPDRTGWVCRESSAESLAMEIGRALGDIESGRDLRASSREYALENYDAAESARRYMELFQDLREQFSATNESGDRRAGSAGD